jgi:hypothetical protein
MIAALLAGLFLSGSPTVCRAVGCSCVVPGPLSTARAGDETIFEGRVLQVGDTTIWRTHGPRLRHIRREWRVVTFVVNRVWNGAAPDTVRVLTGLGGGDCGYLFREGDGYVVFASRLDAAGPAAGSGPLVTGICTHTTEGKDATAIRAALGTPLREGED